MLSLTPLLPARPVARHAAPGRPVAVRLRAGAAPEKAAEHFEPADVKVGECLLEDARDAIEACKGMSPADEAACMLQHGCDAGSVHARLDGEEGGKEGAGAVAAAGGEATKAAAA